MEYKIDEAFIKQAYAAACPEWKSKIREKFPKIFKTDIIDMLRNAGLGSVHGFPVIEMRCGFILIPLPNTNEEWTYAAFDLCKRICEFLQSKGNTAYPVHGSTYEPTKDEAKEAGCSTYNFLTIKTR